MAGIKSAQRRRDLVTAASSVIAEQGIANTSVRAVAQRAAVSVGSVLYHFDSFDQLVTEALKGVIDEFGVRRKKLIDGVADPVERLRLMIEAGIPEHMSDELRMVYEISAVVRDYPQVSRDVAIVVERQVALYEVVIEVGVALGAFRPRMDVSMIAANLVALEDAYDLYLLDPVNRQRDRYLENTLRFAEIALDCSFTAEPASDSPNSEDHS